MPEVQGLASLRKKLQKMPERAKVRIREALVNGAAQIVEAQKKLARTSKRTGNLIESDNYRDGDHELQVVVYNDAFYARYVEFGTTHSAAEPFFFPGYRLLRKRVKGQIRYSVSKAVKEVSSGSK